MAINFKDVLGLTPCKYKLKDNSNIFSDQQSFRAIKECKNSLNFI